MTFMSTLKPGTRYLSLMHHARGTWRVIAEEREWLMISSWYKNNIIGGKLWVWGGSVSSHQIPVVSRNLTTLQGIHYIKTIKEPKYEHYNYTYKNSNMFAYLGNGRLEAEWKQQVDKLAPYIRNEDTEWDF